MSVDEGWERARLLTQLPDTREARLAFQAGARYALSELTAHLGDIDEAVTVGLRLNYEILAFASAANMLPTNPR